MARTPTHVTGGGPLLTGCGLLVGAAYVAAVDPSRGGWWLPCPLRTVTGWWCPGCGMTRATHHLVGGDLVTALRLNMLVVPVLALIAACWVSSLLSSVGVAASGRRVPGWVYATAILAVTTFGVLRNVPGVTGLRG